MQITRIEILCFLLLTILLTSCSKNDYSADYQKELPYDGTLHPIDTMMIDVYSAAYVDGEAIKEKKHSSIVKWYDINGYNSMTKSILYLQNGNRETLEQISRDKNSLPIARDIKIYSPNAETIVTLARLKRRHQGKEEWLLRHYLDPKRYLEDTSVQCYTSDARTIKKESAESDSLLVMSIDRFNDKGYLISKEPTTEAKEGVYIRNYYNANGLMDSVVSETYMDNNLKGTLLKKHTESYQYDFLKDGNVSTMYTYYNDSLIYISDYKYAHRKTE